MKFIISISLFAFIMISFKINEDEVSNVSWPENFGKPNYDFSKNKLTKPKILLGRVLFYDPILSANNTISCASCHSQYNAFAHADHALSHGIYDSIGTRNAPALMNLAWQKSFMWDGAINHLEMQALAPISNKSEMNETIGNVISKLNQSKKYRKLFYDAFADSTITSERLLKSITQFMLTLVSANSRYDSVINNKATFTAQEENGYYLFQKNCASCHSEPLFSSYEFESNGLSIDTNLNDYGRIRITLDSSDYLKFKVPTLRNIEFSYPYMHDGRYKKLSEVVNHYTSIRKNLKYISPKLKAPIILNSNEKVDLIAFLLTLSDRKFVFNNQYSFPKENLLKE